jgi:hypothetical protein
MEKLDAHIRVTGKLELEPHVLIGEKAYGFIKCTVIVKYFLRFLIYVSFCKKNNQLYNIDPLFISLVCFHYSFQ